MSGLSHPGPKCFQIDHVVPLSGIHGGTDHPDNWELIGHTLNMAKKTKTFEEYFVSVKKDFARGPVAHAKKIEESDQHKETRGGWKQELKFLDSKEQYKKWIDQYGGWKKLHSKQKEYLGKAVGLKQLSTVRLDKNGGKRTGSCQRNYTWILFSFLGEWLYGDEKLAFDCYHQARSVDKDYTSGRISLTEYCRNIIETVERRTVDYTKSKSLKDFHRDEATKYPEYVVDTSQGL